MTEGSVDWIKSIDWKDSIHILGTIFAIAISIYNLIYTRRKDQVRVEVIPKSAWSVGINSLGHRFFKSTSDRFNIKETEYLAIEVINKSNFSIIIGQIGLKLKKGKGQLGTIPIFTDDEPLPRKVESRNSITAYLPIKNIFLNEDSFYIEKVFIETQCNKTIYGSSNALKEFLKFIRNHKRILDVLDKNFQTSQLSEKEGINEN